LVDRVRIRVQDAERVCTDFAEEGEQVQVRLGWGDENAEMFHGIITAVDLQSEARQYPRTVQITALDMSHLMNRTARSRESHQGSLSDILRAVVTGNSEASQYIEFHDEESVVLEDRLEEIEFAANAPLVQRNETDLQFIYRIARLYNARTFVEYVGNNKSRFHFISESLLMGGDAMMTISYCPGFKEVIDLNVRRVESDRAPITVAVAVDPRTGEVRSAATTPADTHTPTTPDASHAAHLDKSSSGRGDRYRAVADVVASPAHTRDTLRAHDLRRGLPSNPNDVEHITRDDLTRGLGYRANGELEGNITMRAKGLVSIIGLAAWEPSKWYVRKVNHIVNQDERGRPNTYRTKFVLSR
jgi:phage protein D